MSKLAIAMAVPKKKRVVKKDKQKYKAIPIVAAKHIAQQYNKDQVIILAWDKTHGLTHVTTYGKSQKDCEQAAQGGNKLKKALGWPEDQCQAVPARVKRKALKEHQWRTDPVYGGQQCATCGLWDHFRALPKKCPGGASLVGDTVVYDDDDTQ